jgi:diadenosine tetraphosphate (Ap4A) HIT family hydrolase
VINFQILFSLENEHETDKHIIIINNSPIRPYHVLIVPDRKLVRSQVMSKSIQTEENA